MANNSPKPDRKVRLITSRNRAPYSAILVANAIDCDAIRLGSAGAKAMAVVLGEADIYVHDGGQHQWDSAAPVAVARAAGLHLVHDGHGRVFTTPQMLPGFFKIAISVKPAKREENAIEVAA